MGRGPPHRPSICGSRWHVGRASLTPFLFPYRLFQPHSFLLDLDTSSYGDYTRGGIVTQFKESKVLAFKTLAAALAEPGEFLLTDFSKMERPALLHLGFQALDLFEVWGGGGGGGRGGVVLGASWQEACKCGVEEQRQQQKDEMCGTQPDETHLIRCPRPSAPPPLPQAEQGHAPRPANAADAERVIALVKALNEALPEAQRASLDEAVLRKLAHCAGGELNPMAAMFGGVVGQEVMKAMSGKVRVWGGRVGT